MESAKYSQADIDEVIVSNRDFMGTRPRLVVWPRYAE
jgi:hypothetical protein